METFVLILLFIPYLIIKYFTDDHDTAADKDRKRFSEGIELVQNKQYEEAYAFFTLLVNRYPKSAIAHLYKGICNYYLSNYYSAIYDFTRSASFDNTLWEACLYKGMSHLELGEITTAFLELDKAVWHTRSENPNVLRFRGEAHFRLHHYDSARLDWEKAAQLGDENAAYLLQTNFGRPFRLRKSR
ncbi:MAG: hypothetical protein QM669_02185 [Siphonobacter sp.]